MYQSEQSEQSRSIPTLIRERNSSILKSRGTSVFFGIADRNEGNVIALKFISELGEQKAIHYHDIISPMDYDGSSEITLSTSRISITINGRNLDDLFDHIIQHEVKWIREPQGSFTAVEEEGVEVTSIRFESLQ
jgi:hypothetical protein